VSYTEQSTFEILIEPRSKSEGEKTMKTTTAVKDPVCGMDVETATAAGRTEHKGQTYYFCGSKCKEKFDINPEQYVGKSTETAKSGGCCS
jgi:Cu+-exporting ATPase